MPKVKTMLRIPAKDAPSKEWREAGQAWLGSPGFQRFYRRYMESEAWSNKRVKVFEEKGFFCRARLGGCDGMAYQVHHKTYARVGGEKVDDLEPVCRSCHKKLHGVQ